MSKIKDFLKEKEEQEPSINDYTWETEYELSTNNDNMNEWLEEHLPAEYTLIEESVDGSYAEIKTIEGHKFACHASGNGDFQSHKIEFQLLEKAKQVEINEEPQVEKSKKSIRKNKI